jgi:hypothetical protein
VRYGRREGTLTLAASVTHFAVCALQRELLLAAVLERIGSCNDAKQRGPTRYVHVHHTGSATPDHPVSVCTPHGRSRNGRSDLRLKSGSGSRVLPGGGGMRPAPARRRELKYIRTRARSAVRAIYRHYLASLRMGGGKSFTTRCLHAPPPPPPAHPVSTHTCTCMCGPFPPGAGRGQWRIH